MNTIYIEIIKNSVTAIVAIASWFVGNYFTNKRDISAKRRELSLQHMINAYRVLADEVSHRPETEERLRKLELVITEIQLFGSPKQVHLAKQLAVDVASGDEFQLDGLINDLRHSLREEIGLSKIDGNVKWLRSA